MNILHLNLFSNYATTSPSIKQNEMYTNREFGDIAVFDQLESYFNKVWSIKKFIFDLLLANFVSFLLSLLLFTIILSMQGCSLCKPQIIEKVKYIEKPCPTLQTLTPKELNISKENKELKLHIKIKPAGQSSQNQSTNN